MGAGGKYKQAIRRRAKKCEASASGDGVHGAHTHVIGTGWEIKRRDRKPVSVFESAIYLRNLPPDIGRAALICQYIWSCRLWYRTRMASLTSVVSSCLAFSPSPAPVDSGAGSYFLLRLHKITPICAFRSRVPFPVRTFLTGKKAGATENPALKFHKFKTNTSENKSDLQTY